MRLPLVLPDVNASEFRFTVNATGEIVYGLGAIKGIGEGPVESLADARAKDGPFLDLFDFCRRTDPKRVNKRALEALIRSGAMDGLGAPRQVLMAAMPEALKAAEQQARNHNAKPGPSPCQQGGLASFPPGACLPGLVSEEARPSSCGRNADRTGRQRDPAGWRLG